MCDITLFIGNSYEKNEKGIKLAENNAYFVMIIIITCENGAGGKQMCENGVR